MKQILISIFILCLVLNCKSSYSKAELLKENRILKERIKTFETNPVNKAAALEVKNMNVVYRGVSNPVYISKPNVLSYEASAPGLKKLDSLGNYMMYAGSGKTVDIKIKSKLKNGDSLTEIKRLRIKDISSPIGTINGIGCGSKCEVLLEKNELLKGKIGIRVNDLLFDWELKINSFKIHFRNKTYDLKGDIIDNSIEQEMKNLNKDDQLIIYDINYKIVGAPSGIRYKNPSPILIRVVE